VPRHHCPPRSRTHRAAVINIGDSAAHMIDKFG